MEIDNLIKIGTFTDSLQANMAKEILISNGIDCVVTGDEFKMFNLLSDNSKPVQLIINSKDKTAAEELLVLFFSENTDSEIK